jgi:hypothetical protein
MPSSCRKQKPLVAGAGDDDSRWIEGDGSPPRMWRGLTISTPYFAAVDFESKESPTGSNFQVMSNPSKPQGDVSSGNIFDALRYYRIPGWSSNIRDK